MTANIEINIDEWAIETSTSIKEESSANEIIKKEVTVNFYDDWKNLKPLESALELSIDIETTGLDPTICRMRLVQVYLPAIDQVAVVDLWNMTPDQVVWLELLKKKLKSPMVTKYLQNSLFDLSWFLWKWNLLAASIVDSRILSQIDKAGLYDGYKFVAKNSAPNSLKSLSIEFGYDHDKSEQSSDWSQLILSDSQIRYAARDPIVTYLIGKQLHDRLSVDQKDVVDAELGCITAFCYMNYVGLPSDPNRLFQLAAKYGNKASKLKEDLSNLMPFDPCQRAKIDKQKQLDPSVMYTKKNQLRAGWKDKPFLPSSSSQILAYLHSLGYKEYTTKKNPKTGTTSESAGKAILFEIYAENPEQTQLLNIIEYRQLAKAASTLHSYLDSFQPLTGSIAVSYSVLATQGMGRSSSGGKDDVEKKPQNAQNFSKYLPSHQKHNLPPIRSAVMARDGYSLCEIDLSASHAQLARSLSGDRNLQESYDSGVKLHYYTLSSMLAMEGTAITPRECMEVVTGKVKSDHQKRYKNLYKLAKNVFYSFLNYSGAATLQALFFKYEIFVSLRDCDQYLEACAEAFSGLRRYQNKVHAKAQNSIAPRHTNDRQYLGHFGITEPIDGSLIYLRAQWNQKRGFQIKISDAVSVQWMRPEATVMKKSVREIFQKCQDEWGLDSIVRLITYTHDSVMLEIKDENIPNILPVSCDIITNNMKMYVPDYEPEDPWESCILGKYWEKDPTQQTH